LSLEFGKFDQGAALSSQRELFENAFPENRGLPSASIEHYQWKFHSAPFSPASYEYSAIERGRMLGYYAAIPYPYQIAEQRVLAGMVCDVMTHSDARGRGVFTELGRFALTEMEATDLDFVTGYPVRPEVMGGHLRVGWKVAFELPMYLRPLKANAILRSKGLSWLAPVANIGVATHRGLLARRPKAKEYSASNGTPRELLHSSSFEAFREKWSASVKNHLVKSAEFYDWRLGAPGAEYHAFVVHRDDDVVVAAAVGREVHLHGIPSFALLDVMGLRDSAEALSTLYHDIECEAWRRGAEAIVTMMSRYRAREYRLSRFGFLKSPFTFKLIIRSLNGAVAVDRVSAEKDWHVMWIDSDDL
jgi:GNAT superfamily N-acetyltransferase